MVNIPQKNKYKIALFHGPVTGSKTDLGIELKSETMRAKDFNGYDFAFFGDIHKYQYLNKNKTFAYSGSLIQQSHGESSNNHGILKWDLLTKKSKLLEINNDYGHCTIHIVNGEMIETYIPKKPYMRCICENTSNEDFSRIKKMLSEQYEIIGDIKEIKTPIINKISENGNHISINTDRDKFIKKYLESKSYDKTTCHNLMELHKKIYKEIIDDTTETVLTKNNQHWKLLELKFSNMLSYGENNIIDFNQYKYNQIIGILAPNHYGKSAIIDIILFCLFEKCSRGIGRDILNKNKNNMECSLLLSVGSKKYLIKRKGGRSKKNFLVPTIVEFSCIENENVISLTENKIPTNKKILELVGTYDDFLTTCICLQQGKHVNFIDMTHLEKKEYLTEMHKLNVFNNCCTYANDKLKSLTIEQKIMEKQIEKNPVNLAETIVTEFNNDIINLEKQKRSILTHIELINKSLEFIRIPELIQYHDLTIYKLKSEEDIINTIDKLTSKLNKISISDTQTNKSKNTNKISELNSQIQNNEKLIDNYDSELKDLYEKRINIPMDDLNIESLHSNKKELQKQINNNNQTLKKLNSKIMTNTDKYKIEQQIKSLEQLIEYTFPVTENKIKSLMDQYKIINTEILDISELYFNKTLLTHEQRIILSNQLKLKADFAEHINNTINGLQTCDHIKEVNDTIQSQIKWLDEYNIWKENTTIYLKNNDVTIPDISSMLKKSRELLNCIINMSLDIFTMQKNNVINNEITDLKHLLKNIEKKENINNQQTVLNEKLKLVNKNIQNIEQYQKNILINQKISTINNKIKNLKHENLIAKSEIIKIEDKITKNTEKISETKTIVQHLNQLELYKLHFMEYHISKEKYNNNTNAKNELDNQLNDIDRKISKTKNKLLNAKKNLKLSINYKKEYDTLNKDIELYEQYSKCMNYNGIPYEILKTIIPEFQYMVNETIHNMANFTVEFILYQDTTNTTESQQKTKKTKKKKTKTPGIKKTNNGAININICYPDTEPCDANLASGSEKFIIGSAIRIALCNMSKTAKPNFFVIDEGWSCLDDKNLSNIDSILNYMKSQFDHVIIISHLEQLKNQVQYTIDINKRKGFSYVNNSKEKEIKIKKNKKKIIEV